ncbi:TonB-dependent receptor plug domain-containing protein [Rubritalea profundi]|uniref:TonB-dependent receptor plug domain-containing protein n=1 Tax=Rubritalea profundi TaxID=1658618 RepID=UPI000CF37EF3|nr:TonB-dependent receptor plug domain-containing protein [Rubritalea profundi]
MKYTKSQRPNTGAKVVAGLIVASQVTAIAEEASAQTVPKEAVETLDPTTVLASKFDNPISKTVSSVSVVTGEEIEIRQRNRTLDALNDLPGIQGLSTAGQTGAFGSVIVRGLQTKYTQVVVDGVRITDSTNGLNNFLTNAQTGQITQLELLRGLRVSYTAVRPLQVLLDLTQQLEKVTPLTLYSVRLGPLIAIASQQARRGKSKIFNTPLNLGLHSRQTTRMKNSLCKIIARTPQCLR